jgi:hypothetical protein
MLLTGQTAGHGRPARGGRAALNRTPGVDAVAGHAGAFAEMLTGPHGARHGAWIAAVEGTI